MNGQFERHARLLLSTSLDLVDSWHDSRFALDQLLELCETSAPINANVISACPYMLDTVVANASSFDLSFCDGVFDSSPRLQAGSFATVRRVEQK